MKQTFTSKDREQGLIGYGDAYVMGSNKPDTLVGKTLTIIEGLGLPNKQEEAVKNMIKSTIYDTLLDRTTFIPGPLHDLLVDYNTWYDDNGYPRSGNIGEARVVNGMPSNYNYTVTIESKD